MLVAQQLRDRRLQGRTCGGPLADRWWRPRSQTTPKEGAELLFHPFDGADVANRFANLQISGKGKKRRWFGWPENAKMEAMRDAYSRSCRGGAEEDPPIPEGSLRPGDLIPLGHSESQRLEGTSLTGVARRAGTPVFLKIDKVW